MTWLRRELLSLPYVADTILAVCVYAITLLAPGPPPPSGAEWRGQMQPLTAYDIALASVVCALWSSGSGCPGPFSPSRSPGSSSTP